MRLPKIRNKFEKLDFEFDFGVSKKSLAANVLVDSTLSDISNLSFGFDSNMSIMNDQFYWMITCTFEDVEIVFNLLRDEFKRGYRTNGIHRPHHIEPWEVFLCTMYNEIWKVAILCNMVSPDEEIPLLPMTSTPIKYQDNDRWLLRMDDGYGTCPECSGCGCANCRQFGMIKVGKFEEFEPMKTRFTEDD